MRKCWGCGRFIPKYMNENGKVVPEGTPVFYQKCSHCGVLQ